LIEETPSGACATLFISDDPSRPRGSQPTVAGLPQIHDDADTIYLVGDSSMAPWALKSNCTGRHRINDLRGRRCCARRQGAPMSSIAGQQTSSCSLCTELISAQSTRGRKPHPRMGRRQRYLHHPRRYLRPRVHNARWLALSVTKAMTRSPFR